MSELFTYKGNDEHYFIKTKNKHYTGDEVVELLNKQSEEINYWKKQAMTLLMQVRRLTPRMTDKEVIEFGKELEDE